MFITYLNTAYVRDTCIIIPKATSHISIIQGTWADFVGSASPLKNFAAVPAAD